ncbi:transcriptional regulator [Hydrogenophaga sp.]|uniref:transcriptional regulator n=1 Tax=Hydrogenophaga sp. TaxID=1904254 RepID=UPI0027192F38|nr:transcriptional regulator [Hydrogenophaga sp.]MDO9435552.1 transcriptional regulator [Hydrogenophaga sp.]
MEHKLEFAQRLRDAMVAAGLAPRPSVLLNLFNARYWGRSVSFQGAARWLRGESIPEQDKLLVLAEILRIEPETLRFGQAVRQKVQEQRARWEEGLSYQEREVLDAYLNLPVAQRKILREVIMAFAHAHPQPAKEKEKEKKK